MKFPRILVKAPNWLGDAVMAGPFYSALRDHWKKGSITVLARPGILPIVGNIARADALLEEKRHDVFGLSRLLGRGGFDISFSLSLSLGAAAAMALARIPVRVGFSGGMRGPFLTLPVRLPPRAIHKTGQFMALAARAGAGSNGSRKSAPRWNVLPADSAEASRFLGRNGVRRGADLVALAVGAAYGPSNRWFVRRWAELADGLFFGRGTVIVLVGGERERGKAREVGELTARRPLDATGAMSLGGTAALLARCRAVVSGDSGLMHVAAALGTPTLGMISSGNPAWTGPKGRKAAYLWAEVTCAPCYRRACLPGRGYACLEALTVDRVMEKLAAMPGGR